MENTRRRDKIYGRHDDLAPGLRLAPFTIPLSLLIPCDLSRLLVRKRHLPVLIVFVLCWKSTGCAL
jgi:hypothetical protein